MGGGECIERLPLPGEAGAGPLSVRSAFPLLHSALPFPQHPSLHKELLQRWHLQRPQHLQLHGHGLQRSRLHRPRWVAGVCQLL